MDLLSQDNYCGQSLMKLVSRGSAIITELLRLSEYVPSAFLDDPPVEAQVYAPIISDFSCLKDLDTYENSITDNQENQELDETFREANIKILERFYLLFDSVYRYHSDYLLFLKELNQGTFIHYNPENLLQHPEGKKLMVEAIYLLGVMLLLMDIKIPGAIRERLLVSYYRYKGHSMIQNIDEVCALCRITGYIPGETVIPTKRPPGYPEEYFMRCPVPLDIVEIMIGHLKDDDFYSQITVYPSPEHRPTALSNQAAMLFIILYFFPSYLDNENNRMREIVDKFFPDNWVIAFYLGFTVDLAEQWSPYKAAKSALLGYTLVPDNIQKIYTKYMGSIKNLNKALNHYLKEGVLIDEYILSHRSKLMNNLRDCNVTLRWVMLAKLSGVKKIYDQINNELNLSEFLQLLMNTAQFERNLKAKLDVMLEKRQSVWAEDKSQAAIRMKELSDYFSGNRPLTRGIQKNEQYERWFLEMENQINSMNFDDAGSASRKIQMLIQALDDIEQYHQIEGNLQIKQFLQETKDYMRHMVDIVNLNSDILQWIARISDFSYAWNCMDDFTVLMQETIRKDPRSVRLLESTILKLSSIMNIPLVRILESNSPDLESVTEYYSKELVKYVRKVLQVIPNAVFRLLDEIAMMQGGKLSEMPAKIKREDVRNYACLEERHRLASLTHQISDFTKGILIMEKTFVGLIEIDPKKLLEEGIRRELVNKISEILNTHMNFKEGNIDAFVRKLDSLTEKLRQSQQALEYIQDLIGLYGLKIWQEEMTRVIGFNIDLEASSFLPLISSNIETYQSATIPIPKYKSDDTSVITFAGRLLRELLKLCDIKKNIYIEWMHGWYDPTGREIVGIDVMSKLYLSIGVHGLAGLDKLLCCTLVHNIKIFIRKYKTYVAQGSLNNIWKDLQPISCVPEKGKAAYQSISSIMKSFAPEITQIILRIGQMQLLRRLIGYEINFRGRIDSPLLWSALSTVNISVVNDIKGTPDFPSKDDNLITNLELLLNQMGFTVPFEKIYVKPGTLLEKFPLMMTLLTINAMGSLQYDKRIGGLIRIKQEPIDGVPFISGILTIFKQFHSEYLRSYFGYIGQFVSTSITVNKDSGNAKKAQESALELTNLLVFVEELRKMAGISRQDVDNYMPSYILDKI
jgi:WASH complex subunit strumpellin